MKITINAQKGETAVQREYDFPQPNEDSITNGVATALDRFFDDALDAGVTGAKITIEIEGLA